MRAEAGQNGTAAGEGGGEQGGRELMQVDKGWEGHRGEKGGREVVREQ